MAIDPVCGMTVDEQTAPATAVHNGTTYYFCAPGCKRTFEKDPDAVLKGGPPGMGHAPAHGPCLDRKSTRLNSSHSQISYAVFCLKKKKKKKIRHKCSTTCITTVLHVRD